MPVLQLITIEKVQELMSLTIEGFCKDIKRTLSSGIEVLKNRMTVKARKSKRNRNASEQPVTLMGVTYKGIWEHLHSLCFFEPGSDLRVSDQKQILMSLVGNFSSILEDMFPEDKNGEGQYQKLSDLIRRHQLLGSIDSDNEHSFQKLKMVPKSGLKGIKVILFSFVNAFKLFAVQNVRHRFGTKYPEPGLTGIKAIYVDARHVLFLSAFCPRFSVSVGPQCKVRLRSTWIYADKSDDQDVCVDAVMASE